MKKTFTVSGSVGMFIKTTKKLGDNMRISTRGRYSLEAILFLALLPADALVSTREISEKTGISDGYLEQLFILLRKPGIISGVRGAQGGYRLGKPAGDITVGDILRTVEGPLAPVSCLDKESCPSEAECRTRFTWQKLYTEIQHCIDALRISDLVRAYHSMEETEGAL